MRLVGIAGLARNVERWRTSGEQLDRPLGAPDLSYTAPGQPGSSRHPSLQRPRGETLDVVLHGGRHDRVVYQEAGAHEFIDEDIGVVRSRELPCGPIAPARTTP